MDEAVIRIRGIKQERPHFRLGPVDLDVPRGCVTAIVGPNGSGKSSTFRLLMQLARADTGTIELFGEPLGEDDEVQRKRRIGYLPEEYYIHENGFRGADKATFIRQWYPAWDVNRYGELLRLFEVDPALRLGKMSKGMRRKFELALMLAHEPELLLLDEPSSGLDPLAWKKMIAVLHAYMDEGDRTVLMATHNIEEVKRLADYIVIMAQGRILGTFEKDELLTGWRKLFLPDTAAGPSAEELAEMPGFVSLARRGGGVMQIMTAKAAAAEAWCRDSGLQPQGSQTMELDEILEVLVEGLRWKPHGAAGHETKGAGR